MKFQVYFFFMLGHIYMHVCACVCVCVCVYVHRTNFIFFEEKYALN